MWRNLSDTQPPISGKYNVRLITGAERTAYWTGKIWINKLKKSKGRKRRRWQEEPFLREWWEIKQ